MKTATPQSVPPGVRSSVGINRSAAASINAASGAVKNVYACETAASDDGAAAAAGRVCASALSTATAAAIPVAPTVPTVLRKSRRFGCSLIFKSRIPYPKSQIPKPKTWQLLSDSGDDMTCRAAVVVDQLFGRAAARNLADAQALDGKTTLGHRGSNRVSEAAGRVMILDGNDALRFSCAPQQRS